MERGSESVGIREGEEYPFGIQLLGFDNHLIGRPASRVPAGSVYPEPSVR